MWKIPHPPPEKLKNFRGFANFHKKIRPFWGQKYTSTLIDFSIFGRDFGRATLKNDEKLEILVIFSILHYTDGFVGLIFDISPKNRFSSQKVQKYWKSKNGVKTALTQLFKELWAIHVFLTNLKFDDCQKDQRKPAKVQKSWRI